MLSQDWWSQTTSLDFIGAKDDRGDGDNWRYKTCKAPVKSSPPTNQHPVFYRLDALPVAQPTVSEHWRKHDALGCNEPKTFGILVSATSSYERLKTFLSYHHHHHHVSWSWTVEAKYEASPDITILCHLIFTVSPILRPVHSVMSNHSFGCLPQHRTPSIEPNSTLFISRLSGMWQICPNVVSFLCRMLPRMGFGL